MATIITTAFEQWQAADLLTPGDISLDEFVLANVPGLDPGAVINRDAGLPDAAQIVYREPVNAAGVVNKNTVAYSFTLGTNVGDFSFNWIGLICKKTGLLAMVTTVPALEKVKTTATEQGNAFTRSFLIEFNGAAEKTGINTPAETWQIDFTARLTGIDDYQRLLNIDHYGSVLFFDDGWLVQRSGVKYSCLPGLGYVAGLRLANEAAQDVAVGTKPAAVWLDTVWQGSVMTACVPVTDICVITSGDLAEYSDAAGKTHYVFKIAEIAADGVVTDLRPVRNSDDLDKRYLRRAQNLADLDDKGKSRVNLGLGGAAVRNVGQLAGQVAAADDPRIVHAVQDTRKVNNKALSADITLTYSDVNAVPTTRKVNDKPLSADITLTYSDVNAVPTTRKVNNKALSADITLTYSDVNAAAASHKHPWSDITGAPDFITVTNADARYLNKYAMYTASGSFTVPAGVKKMSVELIGGGGGGGGGGAYSGGGGGASKPVTAIVNVTPGTVLSVVVGGGGVGGTVVTSTVGNNTKGNAGTAGGSSSFAGLASVGGGGGYGGTTTGGVYTATHCPGNSGTSSTYGSGGVGKSDGSNNATGYGAGGSAGGYGTFPASCFPGGNGSPGFVKISW